MRKVLSLTFFVLILDQVSKIWVKSTFHLGESLPVLPFFKITFVENPGMAYGIHFGGILGKYLLILLRLVVIFFMIKIIRKWVAQGRDNYTLVPMALILAGAIGNVIDGAFYGLVFDKGTSFNQEIGYWQDYQGTAQLGGSYAGFLRGCVVDMLHFPLFNLDIPPSVPLIGGQHIEFFKYIFNIADTAICIGAVLMYLFRKRVFPNGLDF